MNKYTVINHPDGGVLCIVSKHKLVGLCTNKTQTDRLTYLYKPGFLFGILNKWAKFEDDLQFRSYSSMANRMLNERT